MARGTLRVRWESLCGLSADGCGTDARCPYECGCGWVWEHVDDFGRVTETGSVWRQPLLDALARVARGLSLPADLDAIAARVRRQAGRSASTCPVEVTFPAPHRVLRVGAVS